MFTNDDVLEIYHFFPPGKCIGSENPDGFPLLIKTTSGQGFRTQRSLRQQFERVMTEKTERIPVLYAGSFFDVSIDVVKQLVRENPTLASWGHGQDSIIPKQERNEIVRSLEESLADGSVSKTKFILSHSLHEESLNDLLKIPSIKESLVEDTEDYLLSKAYLATLSDAIHEKLLHGVDGLETTELSPQSLPGAPPIWLIRQRLNQIQGLTVDGVNVLSQFHLEEKEDAVHCTPRKSITSRRDKLIADLQSGHIFYLNRVEFAKTFKELYPPPEDLNEYLSGVSSIIQIGDFVVSLQRLSNLARDAVKKFIDQGYVNMASLVPREVPAEIQSGVLESLTRSFYSFIPGESDLIQKGDYQIEEQMYGSQRQALLNLARNQAMRQWELLKEAPEKDLRFQPEVVASSQNDEQLFRYLAQQKDFETAASEHFTATISELESQNENDFATYWTERVVVRFYNYQQGLNSVEDAKLHEQLSDLLSSYLQKDFLPDMVLRARSQGLVRSRRTRKNVNKFEATLKTTKSELASIASTLNKFSKKQGIPEVDPNTAEEAKKALIQDIIRRMQKPKTDAPLMFLSLVLILFAKHYPCVVYATGKFAPKLLKQLRTKLSDKEYEQVEKWKEQAKTGTLVKEDKEAMVQMAEQVTS